ncbi:MAG: hypothetical protein ACKOWF_18510 [Chloroflexota bacterium]
MNRGNALTAPERARLDEEYRGHETARRLWEGPEVLPTMEEIRDADRWLARIDARDLARSR